MLSNLKLVRLQKGLKQIELAKKLGVTPNTVGITERRGIGTIKTAKRYAKVLKCSPLDLMDI